MGARDCMCVRARARVCVCVVVVRACGEWSRRQTVVIAGESKEKGTSNFPTPPLTESTTLPPGESAGMRH
jgi:hypothetical protein